MYKRQVLGVFGCERDINYGALTIRKVNGLKVNYDPILGTKKIGYPFDFGGNWHFPSCSEILCYAKYDGTNILAYRYWDAHGTPFFSFKVRLWPHVRGEMIGKWKRMLAKHAGIRSLFAMNPSLSAFSFEMYGKEHPHLIHYENDLDIRLLFGIKRDGEIVVTRDMDVGAIPTAELIATVDGDYIWNYTEMQADFEAGLKRLEGSDDMLVGSEGAVWYCRDKRDNRWVLLKCKPERIEAMHFGNHPLSREVLTATAKNVLEASDRIEMKDFEAYLTEEYSEYQIAASKGRMEKIADRLNKRAAHREKMHALWRK